MQKLKAPKRKFKVIGVDTFEGPTEDYLIGVYSSILKAIEVCNQHGGQMNICYVYDDKGSRLHQVGTF